MKKTFRKSAVTLLIIGICLSLFISLDMSIAYAQSSGAGNIRETDVSQARDGCLLVKISGRFSYTSKEDILARINEIRLEACNEGICGLTPDDYVPVRWSYDLEWIAQTRAAEAVLLKDHTRPNDGDFSSLAHNGVTSEGENLAWYYSSEDAALKPPIDIMKGIEQWYDEKECLLNNTGGVVGHYLALIEPTTKSIGIGGFTADSVDMGCVAGEFSSSQLQSEEQTGLSGEYNQLIEIKASSLSSMDSADTTVATVGKPLNLNERFISTYIDETCPYEAEYVSCKVTPLDLVWKSADPGIATVDANGVVTGVSPGNTNITASYKSYSYSTYVQVKEYDPREYNTDTDEGIIDGEYSFTGDGDWYGWSSYVDYDPEKGKTVIDRSYRVTLPQDGRLKIEMTADAGVFLDAQLSSGDDNYYQEWTMGKSGESLDFSETSDVLQKGSYRVIMGYDLTTRPEYIIYGYPGKNYFYHKLTFMALSDEEAAQIKIEKMKEKAGKAEDMIDRIPAVSDLTLDDENTVNAALEAYGALSDEEAGYVSKGAVDKLNAAADRIRKLKETPIDPGTSDNPAPHDSTTYDQCYEGHSFSGWETTKAATEISAGIQTRSCNVCGLAETRAVAQLAPTLSAVRLNKVEAGKRSATVKWKKVGRKNLKKIKKVEIQYSTNKTFKTGVKTKYAGAKKTSYIIKGLQKGRKYYVRIRAYTNAGGTVHVSKWSGAKPVKAK